MRNMKMNSTTTTTTTTKSDWENLRKQARQAENEIDSKLVSFSKLCSSFTAPRDSVSDSSMLNNNTSDTIFETLSIEIEQLLKKLTMINNKMSDSIGVTEITDTSNANVHTLQRHREILRDYTHEYDKTKRNIVSFKEREKLLSLSNKNDGLNSKGLNNRRNDGNNNNNSTSLYLKEYDHLKNSHSLIDQQLELAELTKENLQSQRQTLKMIQHKMNTLAHKFPLINSLMQRIKLKKRKDSIILATIIAVCIIILLLYMF